MSRVRDALDQDQVADRIRDRRGGSLTPLDRVLLHSPPVAGGWNSLLGAIRQGTTLPADIRELVICQVALLNDADYEWAAHAPLAVEGGVTPDQLASLRGGDTEGLTARQRVALKYATEMTLNVKVPGELSALVRQHFDERGVVELTATVGAYNLVSRFLVAMDIQPGDASGKATV